MAKKSFLSNEELDEIRVRGINCIGYGQLAKIVMLDPNLTIEAKAIYAYFCSFSGGGRSAFPGRDKILSDLRISKNTYYKHLNLLIERGYITVCQQSGTTGKSGFHNNIYTIEAYPEHFLQQNPGDTSEGYKSAYEKAFTAKNIAAAGYGNIPKMVMVDQDLDIQAKALYAYLCVFSGKDFTAYPSRDVLLSHLKISHNSYNKYFKQLIDKQYVLKTVLHSHGKFSGQEFYLNQNIENTDKTDPDSSSDPPQPKICDTQNPPEPKICDTQNLPEPKICDTQNVPEPKICDTQNAPQPKICDTQNAPQPKICDTQNSPQPKLCDTQFCDTNNTNINKLNMYIIPSINQADFEKKENDGEMDGESEFQKKEISDIEQEILEQGTLPFEYTADLESLRTSIKYLTEWDIRSKQSYYSIPDRNINGKFEENCYQMFIDCLSEMLYCNEKTYVKGQLISYKLVYKLLMENIFEIHENMYFEKKATLGEFPDNVIMMFHDAYRTRKIKNSKSYLKTIIWTLIENHGIIPSVDV